MVFNVIFFTIVCYNLKSCCYFLQLQQQDAKVKSNNPKGQHPITKHNLHFRNLLNYLDLAFSFA